MIYRLYVVIEELSGKLPLWEQKEWLERALNIVKTRRHLLPTLPAPSTELSDRCFLQKKSNRCRNQNISYGCDCFHYYMIVFLM
jgi:hypothetical protein